jgi:hypothetical protein
MKRVFFCVYRMNRRNLKGSTHFINAAKNFMLKSKEFSFIFTIKGILYPNLSGYESLLSKSGFPNSRRKWRCDKILAVVNLKLF